MRKSLAASASTSTEVSNQRAGASLCSFEQTAQSKILPIDAFGLPRIHRRNDQLRLNFQKPGAERLQSAGEKPCRSRQCRKQQQLCRPVRDGRPSKTHRNKRAVQQAVKKKSTPLHSVSLSAPELKALMSATSERTPKRISAPAKANPKPTPACATTRNVPLANRCRLLPTRSHPTVQEHWIDEARPMQTRRGYLSLFEISLTPLLRVQPARSLAENRPRPESRTDRIKADD